MHKGIRFSQVRTLCAFLAGTAVSLNAGASGLSLEDAEALALRADPRVQSVEASRSALDELSVAAEQLPDPLLKLGMVSLPTDTFDLGQEAMTQVQIGLVQKFPRGHTRSLTSQQIRQRSEGLDETVSDQKLQIILAVREQFLEILKQQHLANINADAIGVFADLADIIQDYYATGRVHQEDVYQAAVELAKVEERATSISQEEDSARARLTTWIDNAAYRNLESDWPLLTAQSSTAAIKSRLPSHPRILALGKHIAASETGVDLARENYKPEFAFDLTYGGRAGTNPDGSSRSDLLSLMIVMDLPLFTNNRQDRVTASRIAESSAAMFTRDDVFRRMQSEIDLHSATWQRQQERIKLFNSTLLPQAAFSSEASFEAYQSFFGDLTTLLRAQITEFELRLDHVRLQAEALKTQARLLYLEGEFK